MGRDFLSHNQLGITWGPEGVLQLRDKQDLSVQTAEEITNPTVKLAAKTVIPSRSLVLVTVLTTLPSCKNKTHFDFIPMQANPHLGPKCVVYPLDYASIKGGSQRGLQALINLGQQDVKLQQGIVLGHFQKAQSEEIMITQEDIFGVNVEEPWAPGEVEEVDTPTPKCHGNRSLLVVLFLLKLQVVPHGTKGTGPKFVTRPVYVSL